MFCLLITLHLFYTTQVHFVLAIQIGIGGYIRGKCWHIREENMYFLRNEYAAFFEGGGFGTVMHACERPWNSRILVFREIYYSKVEQGKIDLNILDFYLYIWIQTERLATDYLYTETIYIHFLMLKTWCILQ